MGNIKIEFGAIIPFAANLVPTIAENYDYNFQKFSSLRLQLVKSQFCVDERIFSVFSSPKVGLEQFPCFISRSILTYIGMHNE